MGTHKNKSKQCLYTQTHTRTHTHKIKEQNEKLTAISSIIYLLERDWVNQIKNMVTQLIWIYYRDVNDEF